MTATTFADPGDDPRDALLNLFFAAETDRQYWHEAYGIAMERSKALAKRCRDAEISQTRLRLIEAEAAAIYETISASLAALGIDSPDVRLAIAKELRDKPSGVGDSGPEIVTARWHRFIARDANVAFRKLEERSARVAEQLKRRRSEAITSAIDLALDALRGAAADEPLLTGAFDSVISRLADLYSWRGEDES